jgi:hypothetical protein
MRYPELKKDEVLGGKLDVEKLGHQLIIAVLGSNHLGHKNLKGVFDYMEYEKGEHLETEFIHDLFTKKTPEIVDKWFGGSINASIILQKHVDM